MSENQKNVLYIDNDEKEFVTIYSNGQLFGIPVSNVQDIYRPDKITRVPLSESSIEGVLNLRGRIVTVINMRRKLGFPPSDNPEERMCVVIEYNNELYSFLVDRVGDVLKLPNNTYEQTPSTLDTNLQKISGGIYRLEGDLMVIIDESKFLNIKEENAA